MARATREWHYVINGKIIPDEHTPERCTGVMPPEWDGETNQFGEPTGFGVNTWCLLSWNVIPQSTLTWWLDNIYIATLPFRRVASSGGLMLYDPYKLGTPDVQYTYHGRFQTGVVHKIMRSGDNFPKWMRQRFLSSIQPYLIGDTHILITYIGVTSPL